jgi:hypothetical protein
MNDGAARGWQRALDDLHAAATARHPDAAADWPATAARAEHVATAAAALRQSALVADEWWDTTLDRLPHEIAQALTRVAPDVSAEALAHYPAAALGGMANAVKGALFELQVDHAVAHGAIPLPHGVEAFRLAGFTAPGYDAELLDAHGHVVDTVQLKASAWSHIIARHYDAHPDIPVWATHEAATDAAHHGLHAFDTGITDHHLTHAVAAAFTDATTTSFGDVVDEVIPQITLAIIAAQAGLALLRGEPSSDVFATARRRAGTAVATSTLAGLAALATGTEAIRLPVVVGVALTRVAYGELAAATRRVAAMGAVVAEFRPALANPASASR